MAVKGIENRYNSPIYEKIYGSLKKHREKEEAKETEIVPSSDDKQGDSVTISSQGWQAVLENMDLVQEDVLDLTDLNDNNFDTIIKEELVEPFQENTEEITLPELRRQEDTNRDSQEQKGRIGFNAAKRARQLAATKNIGQVQTVIALLNQDLSECKAGLQNDMCDEKEVQKVLAMLQQAQKRISEVSQEDGEEENQGFDAFAIASLL